MRPTKAHLREECAKHGGTTKQSSRPSQIAGRGFLVCISPGIVFAAVVNRNTDIGIQPMSRSAQTRMQADTLRDEKLSDLCERGPTLIAAVGLPASGKTIWSN